MPLILNIDTATEHASVCIGENDRIIDVLHNDDPKQHGSFLQPAIQQLVQKNGIQLSDLDAVAVSNGPGSYTGLRVGLASAKGICYALNKPLICVNTLEVMALTQINNNEAELICPMIDARRMEVFTALFDHQLTLHMQPTAMILDPASFQLHLERKKIIFMGSGSKKWKDICQHPNALFSTEIHSAIHLNDLAQKRALEHQYEDLAYVEPFYLKAFFDPSHKH